MSYRVHMGLKVACEFLAFFGVAIYWFTRDVAPSGFAMIGIFVAAHLAVEAVFRLLIGSRCVQEGCAGRMYLKHSTPHGERATYLCRRCGATQRSSVIEGGGSGSDFSNHHSSGDF